MKKTLNGSLYDSEKARDIVKWEPERSSPIFGFTETLKQTRAGKYFLYGKGEANSKYSILTEEGAKGTEEIIPLTPKAALIWARGHFAEKELGDIFGYQDGRTTMSLSVPNKIKYLLEQERAETGKSVSQIVCDMTVKYL
jgi:hypothetical protein